MEHTEGISLEGPPQRLENQYSRIFTEDAKQFLRELITEFDTKVDALLLERERRRIEIISGKWKPEFQRVDEKDWKISEIPRRIKNRKLDLGDVSPSNTIRFTDALYADVQGIQASNLIFYFFFEGPFWLESE